MNYPSIRIEGAILSPDILERIEDAPGQRATDFGLESSVKVKDEIARAWADAQDYWRIFQRKLETLRSESPATTGNRMVEDQQSSHRRGRRFEDIDRQQDATFGSAKEGCEMPFAKNYAKNYAC